MRPQATCLFSVRLILWSLPALEDYLVLSLFLLSSLSQGLSIEALCAYHLKRRRRRRRRKKRKKEKRKRERGERRKEKKEKELIPNENLL